MRLMRRTRETAERGIRSLRRRALVGACLGWLAGVALDERIFAVHAFGFDRERLETTMRERFGTPGVQALHEWLTLLQSQAERPLKSQLTAINAFWNRVVLGSEDSLIWGQPDYWATPLETLGKRAGDCDDYVIGKYFSLLYLGIPGEQLRFIYVRARLGGAGSTQSIAHMVLGHYATPQGEPLVLDNMTSDILPARDRPDLSPVFSFNAQGIYVPGKQPTPAQRISRWPDLLARMQQEGFMP